jgi:hypothetical protein
VSIARVAHGFDGALVLHPSRCARLRQALARVRIAFVDVGPARPRCALVRGTATILSPSLPLDLSLKSTRRGRVTSRPRPRRFNPTAFMTGFARIQRLSILFRIHHQNFTERASLLTRILSCTRCILLGPYGSRLLRVPSRFHLIWTRSLRLPTSHSRFQIPSRSLLLHYIISHPSPTFRSWRISDESHCPTRSVRTATSRFSARAATRLLRLARITQTIMQVHTANMFIAAIYMCADGLNISPFRRCMRAVG